VALAPPVTALLNEFARIRLKMLPKKGDLPDLNNWRGIMLLDAASKILSMIINEHSEQARAPHTNGPRDLPRRGALSLLQKTPH